MEKELPSYGLQLIMFLTNPIFLACFFSWLGAQFLKTAINLIYGRVHSFSELIELMFWRTGGMPSSHSALVTTLSTTIGFRNGFHSDLFILSLALFFITIRDAFGVRRSSGIQAATINHIGQKLKEKQIDENYKPIKEVHGHTPMEVLCGIFFGFFVGLAFSLLK